LTEPAGSSGWFEGGWVTYSNRAKQRDLGVPATLFSEVGAVSREVVLAMAEGALRRADVSYSVAISGVAGPGGGSEAKPVGTVWIGWGHWPPAQVDGAHPHPPTTFAARYRFDGDRMSVRQSAVDVALRGLCAHLAGERWDQSAAARWSDAYWPAAGLKISK
ncbi:MAG TPA: CinA family protein, partial [Chromatiales bacterium]|nr:CinA family protein [Chromatiales bacterium]